MEGRELVSYKYTEHGSKNHAGGLGHLHLENKTVCHFQVLEAGERDYIYILDLYFSKVLSEALEKDNFYLRPLTHVKEGLPWFSSVPIGCNKLATMVKGMCTAGGVEGNKTNHSLLSYGITTMYKHKVPEKVIQERFGHRSIMALRVYERTTK